MTRNSAGGAGRAWGNSIVEEGLEAAVDSNSIVAGSMPAAAVLAAEIVGPSKGIGSEGEETLQTVAVRRESYQVA